MHSDSTFDFNLEASLLCSLIYNTENSTLSIQPDIFANIIYKQIFNAILSLDQQDIPRDEVVIRDYLISHMRVDKEEAESNLGLILTFSPASDINHLIKRLREFKKVRDVKNALLSIHQDITNGKSADEIEGALLRYGEKVAAESSFELFSMHQVSGIKATEPEFACKDFIPIPKKTVTIFSAGGGTGKTFLILQLAMRYLNEHPSEKAFLWLSEDDIGIAKERLNKITNVVYSAGKFTHNRMFITADPTFHAIKDDNRSIKSNPLFFKMKMILRDVKFIVLDPLIAFYGGDENNNSHARVFMQMFTQWAAEEDKIIIFIHHATKNTTQSRGASAIVDAARAVYEVDKIKDTTGKEIVTSKRIVNLTKDNYRASKYFGGFSKEIVVFPPEDISTILQPPRYDIRKKDYAPVEKIDFPHMSFDEEYEIS